MTQSQILNANFDWLQAGKVEHFPEYKIDTQETMYERIAKAKRSTFDRSKFNVVGSPNITDDGIASGFSGADRISLGKVLEGITNKEFEITFTVITGNTLPYQNFIFGTDDILGEWSIIFGYINNQENFWLSSNGTSFDIANEIMGLSVTTNTKYIYKIGFDKTKYYVKRSLDDGKTYENSIELASSSAINSNSNLYLGNCWQANFNGQIDLKQFSITADGIEVFNGNKTGVDQIKKDDFTKVGNPVISDDGIASGFNTNNYLNISNIPIGENKKWKFVFKAPVPTATASNQIMQGSFLHGTIAANNNVWFQLFLSDNVNHNCYIPVPTKYQGTYYNGEISYDGINTYNAKIILNDGIVLTNSFTSTAYLNSFQTYIGRYYKDTGSIDLNTFKIYVDGNLVYQPTLRIPYTQSKTDEKIVDAVYRDRVQDMYEQFGYTHYYTISDKDYTLATVPNEKIVDSYYADNSFMELTADLSLTQAGGAVSGQTINLKRPYKDNKYISTIGTTSKATNSFVASASGQWITKGKGVLG